MRSFALHVQWYSAVLFVRECSVRRSARCVLSPPLAAPLIPACAMHSFALRSFCRFCSGKVLFRLSPTSASAWLALVLCFELCEPLGLCPAALCLRHPPCEALVHAPPAHPLCLLSLCLSTHCAPPHPWPLPPWPPPARQLQLYPDMSCTHALELRTCLPGVAPVAHGVLPAGAQRASSG